ncbi:MAG: hypothetical protein ACR2MG_18545 [Pyrinomonadaceae bacterium]
MCLKNIFRFLFLFMLAANSYAQKQVENPSPSCNPNFARLLVEQQVADGKLVEDTEKRIKISLRSADFLWKFDEETARKYFTEAYSVAEKRFGEKGFEKKETGSFTSYQPDYRTEVIRAIAKKDGDWAKRLSEKLLKEYEADFEARKDSYDKTRELGDLLRIAQETAKDNPQLSLYFFRQVMRYPLDYHWYWSLYATAKENQTLADQIYLEALNTYANESPRRMLFLSAYPFGNERIFGVDKYQYGTSVPSSFAPNPNLQVQFLNTFFNRIEKFLNSPEDLNKPADKYRLSEITYIVSTLQDIEPIVLQKLPNLFERFSSVKAKANAQMNAEARKTLDDKQESYEKFGLSFDERLKRLEDADSKGKLTDYMIVDLVFNLKTEESYAKTATWLDKIKDESVRESTIDFFYFKRSELAAKEKRFDDAKKFADKVDEIKHKAVLYFGIAEAQLKNVSQQSEASDILLEVAKLAHKADDSVEKAQVLLGLAFIYEKFNHYNALTELGEAIRTINKLENPDIFTTAVYSQIKGKDFAHYAVFNTPGFNLETTFEEISKKDFEISLSNAQNLQDKYFRTLAVLAIAKNCVENQRKNKLENKKAANKPKQ